MITKDLADNIVCARDSKTIRSGGLFFRNKAEELLKTKENAREQTQNKPKRALNTL
jgi:tetrahydromethanopterin S-methyltransferase subunit H